MRELRPGVPLYIAHVLPAPLAGLFFLGLWACALGWGGPCQFSGATGLGRDAGQTLHPRANEADLIRYTRWSFVLLTALMIVFGFLPTEQSAWWNVLAWTLRNGATLAPVLAALFWPLATRRSAYAALSLGFLAGLSWYQLGRWAPDSFLFGIHPVWVGMSVNVIVLVSVALVETCGSWRIRTTDPSRRSRGDQPERLPRDHQSAAMPKNMPRRMSGTPIPVAMSKPLRPSSGALQDMAICRAACAIKTLTTNVPHHAMISGVPTEVQSKNSGRVLAKVIRRAHPGSMRNAKTPSSSIRLKATQLAVCVNAMDHIPPDHR